MSTCYIYGLVDPRTSAVRYVGKSVDPGTRLKQHVGAAQRGQDQRCATSPLYEWLTGLLAVGLVPDVTVLATCSEATWAAEEQAWIERIRSEGGDLCNIQIGGRQSRRLPGVSMEGGRASTETSPASSSSSMHPAELIEIRLALGLSQRQLAHILGFNPSTMSLFESGKRRIPHRVRLAIERITPSST